MLDKLIFLTPLVLARAKRDLCSAAQETYENNSNVSQLWHFKVKIKKVDPIKHGRCAFMAEDRMQSVHV